MQPLKYNVVSAFKHLDTGKTYEKGEIFEADEVDEVVEKLLKAECLKPYTQGKEKPKKVNDGENQTPEEVAIEGITALVKAATKKKSPDKKVIKLFGNFALVPDDFEKLKPEEVLQHLRETIGGLDEADRAGAFEAFKASTGFSIEVVKASE